MSDERTCNGCGRADGDLDADGQPAVFRLVKGKPIARCRACEAAAERVRYEARREAEAKHIVDPDPARLTSCIQWGTGLEKEAVQALAQHGTLTAAAEALDLTPAQLRARLSELQRRAARHGWAPAEDMKATVPEGFRVGGVSTYYRVEPDGTRVPTGQWVKSKSDADSRLEALAAAIQSAAEPLRGVKDPVRAPAVLDSDLLTVVPMGDPHLGMHAWAAEAGANFDLEIAEQNLIAAVEHLIDLAPPAREGILGNMGDFFHADGNAATTTAGTRVDVDTRQAKVYRAGVRTMTRAIDLMLQKHEIVYVKSLIGNHDENAATMLATCLAFLYEREPRVQVDQSPAKFLYHRFGKNLLGFTHGNGVKHSQLGGVMSCDRAEDWGQTLERHWYVGHVHHDRVIEVPGVTIETVRTLAPKDAWHAASGYRSGQDMKLDVWHRVHGRISRSIVNVRQLIGSAA